MFCDSLFSLLQSTLLFIEHGIVAKKSKYKFKDMLFILWRHIFTSIQVYKSVIWSSKCAVKTSHCKKFLFFLERKKPPTVISFTVFRLPKLTRSIPNIKTDFHVNEKISVGNFKIPFPI